MTPISCYDGWTCRIAFGYWTGPRFLKVARLALLSLMSSATC